MIALILLLGAGVIVLTQSRASLAASNAAPRRWQPAVACSAPRLIPALYQFGQKTTVLATADFNGDGHLDLLGRETRADFVESFVVLTGDGKTGFIETGRVEAGQRGGAFAFLDFNSDGRLDLAALNDFEPTVQVYLNNGQGGLRAPLGIALPKVDSYESRPFNLRVGDFNGDGRSDLIVGHTVFGDTAIILNNATSGYDAGIKQTAGLSVGDFNGDGATDLLTSPLDSPGGRVSLSLANRQGGFTAPRNWNFLGAPTSQAALADFNGDGNLDAAFGTTIYAPLPGGGGTGSGVSIFFGNGAGGLGEQKTYLVPSLAANQIRALVVVDVNQDGKPDVAFNALGQVEVMLNNGAGGLNEASAVEALGGGLVSGDFNEDGRVDLALFGNQNNFTIYWNYCGTPGLLIYGRVVDPNVFRGVGGVTVSVSGARSATTQTDSGGNFVFTDLMPGGNYLVTAARPDYIVEHPSQMVSNLSLDQPVTFNAQRLVSSVNAASYAGTPLAPTSIVAAFGGDLARGPQTATGVPLPLGLNGTNIEVRDSTGTAYWSQIFFVSPNQVNFLLPPELATGPATIKARFFDDNFIYIATQTIEVAPVAPGLFAANANGQGVAAALALRVKADGAQSYEPVAEFDAAQGRYVARAIDLSRSDDEVFLVLFGTGLRNRSALAAVSASLGGANAEVVYAGAQGDLAGLDQVNVRLPRVLSGRGEVEAALTVDGKPANRVSIKLK